jgi:D-hexose-6-phosphate mutarotase
MSDNTQRVTVELSAAEWTLVLTAMSHGVARATEWKFHDVAREFGKVRGKVRVQVRDAAHLETAPGKVYPNIRLQP